MVNSLIPILATRDLGGLLRFYRDLLGFSVTYEFAGPDGEPVYAALERGTSHLGIGRDPELTDGPTTRFSLWAYVDDCAAAVERLRGAGVRIVEEPAVQPWGETVGRVLDPDDNLVLIGQAATD